MSTGKEYLVIGLMSGSSLDGMDLALCSFSEGKDRMNYRLLAAETVAYPYYMKEKLDDALHISTQDLHNLDQELGEFYASHLNLFMQKHDIKPDLIASHGHTVLHQPDKGITMQIGDGDVIARKTRVRVVSDFRIQDVSKGGQGAPLVPVGDRDLFSEYEFCLNLGGIANISFDSNGNRIACDICPCNMATNTLSRWIGIEYDNHGALAASGEVNTDLLARLNKLAYYKKDPPKSLGKEWFLRQFLPEIRTTKLTIEDALRPVNEHISDQVAGFINNHAGKESRVLATGGGAYNKYLMDLIRNKISSSLVIPDNQLVDFKEAIVFAYLGLLRILDRVNVLASVTGARSNTSAGIINNPN
jgi:anhydro-N-acetylmuramic acid kinase